MDMRNPAYDGPDGIFAGYGEGQDFVQTKETCHWYDEQSCECYMFDLDKVGEDCRACGQYRHHV